ncbi:MAG: hypothetical protein EA361_02770 [Bacteroidetes bacterium]|nr:MAG: hypothetical protein EA361_02770 [Bacteroidota bacterium]
MYAILFNIIFAQYERKYHVDIKVLFFDNKSAVNTNRKTVVRIQTTINFCLFVFFLRSIKKSWYTKAGNNP